MLYVNYAVCMLAVCCVLLEAWVIWRRNRTVTVKGKEDFFSFALVLLFVVLIFPLSENATLVEALRNILVLLVLFGSLGIKRGLSAAGICKAFGIVPWDMVEEVRIEEYQTARVAARFCTKQGKSYQLLFPKYQLKKLLWEIEQHMDRNCIYLQTALEQVLKMNTYRQ